MEESIKVISDMCQGIFGLCIIFVLLMFVLVCCILFITDYYSKRDKDILDSKRIESIKRKEEYDYRLLSHSQQIKYLYDEINKLNKRKKS